MTYNCEFDFEWLNESSLICNKPADYILRYIYKSYNDRFNKYGNIYLCARHKIKFENDLLSNYRLFHPEFLLNNYNNI